MLDAALDLPASERPAFLDSACGHDGELRAEVERLLCAHARAGSFLQQPLPSVAPAVLAVVGPEPKQVAAGTALVGRYVL